MSKRSPKLKRKLSQLLVTRLRPRSRAFLVWDSLERGLALQIQPSAFRSYKFIYLHRASGKSRWINIGAADTVSLAEAREQALALRLQVHQGRDPSAERRAVANASSGNTFSVIANRYVEEFAKKKNKSWKQADTLVRRYALPSWSERDASTISRSDVRAMLAKIDKPILANQVLASCGAVFSWAVKQELLATNPAKGIDRNTTTSRERVLSEGELPQFWRAFCEAGLSGLALQVLLLTGQRPGEIAKFRREHIKDNWWEMPGRPEVATQWPGTKNGESHRIWLPQPVRDILAQLGDDDTGFVFGSQVVALDAVMRDICRQLNAPRATPHDLRRSFGTMVTAMGFGRPAMDRIMNHKEKGVGSIYDRHSYSQENMRVMEAVSQRIIELADNVIAPTNVVSLRT
jgi:integrase